MSSRSNAVVVARAPQRLDVFARGQDFGLFHKAWDGNAWHPSQTGDWESLRGDFGAFPSPPAAASWGPNRIDVFCVAQDRQLFHKFWDTDRWGPGPAHDPQWEPLGGVFTGGAAVASWCPNRIDICGLGFGSGMIHRSWATRGSARSRLTGTLRPWPVGR